MVGQDELALLVFTIRRHSKRLPFLTPGRSKVWAIAYAVYIGLGVSVTVHWLSDAVTGALIGYMIGDFVASKADTKILGYV